MNTYKFSSLCKGGLYENQSIKSFEIDMDAEVEEDAMSMGAEEVFDHLSPLFQRSTSIIAVDFTILPSAPLLFYSQVITMTVSAIRLRSVLP